jgi:MOSC domain-containing protein YiiM
MDADFRVASVNVAGARTIRVGGHTVETGIFKLPATGAVTVDGRGLDGDHVMDPANHGGADQAVYLYGLEDYAWWSRELGRPLEPGTFGENLTLSGRSPSSLRIGDRVRTGSVLLEVTAPRIPCGKLAARLGDPSFPRRFIGSRRPGAYARVLEPGSVRVGDPGRIEASNPDHPTVLDLQDLCTSRRHDEAMVRRCLAAPLAARARRLLQSWLEAGAAGRPGV